MRTRHALAAITLAALAATGATGCGSDAKADPKACKAAMQKDFDKAMAAGDKAKDSDRPAACDGIDDKTVQRYAAEITNNRLSDAAESAVPDTTETPDITPECRAWIEKELRDSSDTIDATSGEDACGYLAPDELDQAIDEVTNDLTK